jgi:hypothetical protein
MKKQAHHYRLHLAHLQGLKPEDALHEPLEIEFDNHDDIFSIVEKLRGKDPFGDPAQATQFAIGLKLFSEVMIKNRKHPLFDELGESFGLFMKKLKSPP